MPIPTNKKCTIHPDKEALLEVKWNKEDALMCEVCIMEYGYNDIYNAELKKISENSK